MVHARIVTLREWIRRRIAIDTRALAALRIALGTILLLDLALRARHLRSLYTDAGVLPRSALHAEFGAASRLSLHALSGSLWFEVVLFGAAGVAALSLLVGYRPRLATLASLCLLLSLHARNPLVLNAGDTLLRRLLFWSLFLPLGERLAVDAPDEPRSTVGTLATLGLLVQVVAVYVVNAVVKLRSDAWLSGRALGLVYQLDTFTTPLGDAVAGTTPLLEAMSVVWVVLLIASPLLFFTMGRARAMLTFAFMAGQVWLLLTVSVGVFPLICLAALLPLLPTTVWDRIWPDRVGGRETRLGETRTAGWYAKQVVLVLALVAVVVSNAATLGVAPEVTSDVPEQSWDMFAPAPPADEYRFFATVTTHSGETVDAFDGVLVGDVGPPEPTTTYPSARWRKYLSDVRVSDSERLQRELAAFHCRRFTTIHDEAVSSVKLAFVVEETHLDGADTYRRETVGRYECR